MLDSKAASSGTEAYSAASTGDNNDPFLPDYPDDLP
jgi:chemotaxis methyl-accepting protein methylase